MSATTATVYVTDDFSAPMAPQHNFANHYDLDNPTASMSLYARVMHEHTKHQLEGATSSARRRSQGNGSITSDSSRGSSISSASS